MFLLTGLSLKEFPDWSCLTLQRFHRDRGLRGRELRGHLLVHKKTYTCTSIMGDDHLIAALHNYCMGQSSRLCMFLRITLAFSACAVVIPSIDMKFVNMLIFFLHLHRQKALKKAVNTSVLNLLFYKHVCSIFQSLASTAP